MTVVSEKGSDADIRPLIAQCDLFGLLAVMLEYKTLGEVLKGISECSLQGDVATIKDELGLTDCRFESALERLSSVKECIDSGTYQYSHLRREYTRLFNHPDRPAMGFYEGVFVNRRAVAQGKGLQDHDVLFINQAANDADRQYKRASVRRSPDENIPADCMATEMAFMQYLLRLKAEAVLDDDREHEQQIDAWLNEFKRLHLKVWMKDFYVSCEAESPHAYFKAIGLLGQTLAEYISV
jgi:TorA maturation chaperone TorD